MSEQRFAIRYTAWFRWFMVAMAMGPRRSWVAIRPDQLEVRMGWGFRMQVPRTSISSARAIDAKLWWGIGVHTDLRGTWIVNGSQSGMVEVRFDPRAAAKGPVPFSIHPRAVALSLEEPEAFLAALGAPPGVPQMS